MSEQIMDETVLNLVVNKPEQDLANSESFKGLFKAIEPQVKIMLDQVGTLYRQSSDAIMNLVPGDWDTNRFPEPATKPIVSTAVRLLETTASGYGKPKETLELKIRGKNQIAIVHSDLKEETSQEHLFQRINPKELTPEQRTACAEAIRNAKKGLLDQNEQIFQNPEAHHKQLEEETRMFESGEDVDILIPFQASGTDANGNQATHLIDWAGRRPEEVASTILADMADKSAYRDNPANVAGLLADHLKLHPVADAFKKRAITSIVDSNVAPNQTHDEDGNVVIKGHSIPVEEINPDMILGEQIEPISVEEILQLVQEGKLSIKDAESLLDRDNDSTNNQAAILMGPQKPLDQLNAAGIIPTNNPVKPNIEDILQAVKEDKL